MLVPTWGSGRARSSTQHGRALRVAVAAAVGVAALVVAFALSRQPLGVVLLVGVVGLVVAATRRPIIGLGLLVASFYVEHWLGAGVGPVTIAKGIGLIALGGWFFDWIVKDEPLSLPRLLLPLAGLALWIVPSTAAAHDLGRATVVGTRYAMFFVLFFLVVQLTSGRPDRVALLMRILVVSASVAAAIGLFLFLTGVEPRARGPIDDPNDFGFLLASVVPLAIAERRSASRRAQAWALVSVLILFGAILATFSRGALVALVGAAVWAVWTRRLSLRGAALGVAGLVLAGLLAWQLEPALVESALTQKQNVAQTNVDTRMTYWGVALEQFASSPALGVGPGNYESRFSEFRTSFATDTAPATHNTYLNILAELGVPGLLLFLWYLVAAWLVLRRRPHRNPAENATRSALAAGFLVAVVGSVFLTQQHFAPIWLLPPLCLALDQRVPARLHPSVPVAALPLR